MQRPSAMHLPLDIYTLIIGRLVAMCLRLTSVERTSPTTYLERWTNHSVNAETSIFRSIIALDREKSKKKRFYFFYVVRESRGAFSLLFKWDFL